MSGEKSAYGLPAEAPEPRADKPQSTDPEPEEGKSAETQPAGPHGGKPADAEPKEPETKPGETDQKAETPDEKPQETDADRFTKQFQTLHQQKTEFLKKFHPQVEEEWNEFRNTGIAPATAEPAKEPDKRTEDDDDLPPLETDEDGNISARAMLKATREMIRNEREKERRDDQFKQMKTSYLREEKEVNKQYEDFINSPRLDEAGKPILNTKGQPIPLIPPDVVKEAESFVKRLRITKGPGGPTAAFEALTFYIDTKMRERGFDSIREDIRAQEADRIRGTLDASQPGPTQPAAPGAESDKMKDVRTRHAAFAGSSVSELFDNPD